MADTSENATLSLQQILDILEEAKEKIGRDKRVVFWLNDPTNPPYGRYFEISERKCSNDNLGRDGNERVVTLEIVDVP